MPAARSNSQCPYCDHQSPAGSKFCNDCGAALHLRPCPHCGSVNDISLTALCSRCNGALGNTADTDDNAVEVEPTSSPTPTPTPSPPASPTKAGRAPLIVFALLGVAAAGYYGLRSEPELSPRLAATAVEPMPAAASSVVVVNELPVSAAPVQDETSSGAAAGPAAPAVAASLARLAPPGAGKASVRREAAAAPPAATATTATVERRSGTGAGLDLKPPQIGTCTDAVAALGLCTPDPTPRRP